MDPILNFTDQLIQIAKTVITGFIVMIGPSPFEAAWHFMVFLFVIAGAAFISKKRKFH